MMENAQHPNRLQKQLARLIALEAAIEQQLKKLAPAAAEHAEATALLTGFQTLPEDHRQALETRLCVLTENAPPMEAPAAIYAVEGLSEGEAYPISTALQLAHTMFNQAVIGYSMLVSMGARFLDSPFSADEGTAFHLAKQHMGNYTQAIQQITHLLYDVLLAELDAEGFECQCQCPSCGAGVCLCSLAGRLHLSRAWEAAGPMLEDGAIYVQLPRQDSVAARAGLQKGDLVIAAGGYEIDSFGVIQGAIRDVGPGEDVQLTVQRKSEASEDVVYLHL
jgi:membrane-associated protease RseP (regulator of RpoE activity)